MKVYLFKRVVLNCSQATLLSAKKEEGVISMRERMQLWWHLLYCAVCRRFVKQMQILSGKMGEMNASLQEHPPHTFSTEQKAEMQKRINISEG
ncbi:MAG: hypothetical protein J0I41_09465 [Filimonas sp.]|nr:hypothetical protein [Filimonas sp.]